MASYRWPITRRSDLSELPAVKHSDRPCLLSRNTAFHNSQHNGVARIVQSCSVPSYPGPDLLLAGPRFRKKCGAPNIRIPSYFHRNPQHHRTITSDAARMTDNYINTKDSWVTVTSLRSYCTKIHTNSIIYNVYCKLYLLAYCADYNIYDTSTVISMRFVRCNNKDIQSVSQSVSQSPWKPFSATRPLTWRLLVAKFISTDIASSSREQTVSTLLWLGVNRITYWSQGVACLPHKCQSPLPSARQHPSYGDWLQVKRKYYQNCSVVSFSALTLLVWWYEYDL